MRETMLIKKQPSKRQPGKRQQGFTLLEALIAFLILSIGMLGIASLQTVSLKAGQTSVYVSVAVMKAEEILESMRANSVGLASYAGSGSGANNSCGGTTQCSSAQLAQDDIFWWKKSLKAGLPDNSDTTTLITVTAPVAPSKMATVTVDINWKQRSKTSDTPETKTASATTYICTAVPC